MPRIQRSYPGKEPDEIYRRVNAAMERIAAEMGLDYRTDEAGRTGQVAKMGITGTYAVSAEAVTVDLRYPMLVPGALRRKVEERIGEKLDGLFA